MYDSVTPSDIPRSAPAVAGYVNGRYAWSAAGWDLFPSAYRKTISITASQVAMVLDVEAGDASPDQAPAWVRLSQRAGVAVPTLYCSRLGTWPATQAACRGLVCNYWVADYTGVAHLVPGSVATQWEDAGPYDLSTADLAWLSGNPAPPAAGMNAPAVAIRSTPTGLGYWVFAADGGVFSFGDAVFYGALPPLKLAAPIVDAEVAPDGKGYRMLGADGGVFCQGSAAYLGRPA